MSRSARDDRAGVALEQVQQLELLARELDLLAVAGDLVARRVERAGGRPRAVRLAGPGRRAPQDRADSGDQLARANGLTT